MAKISRRDFLKGSAAGVLGAAALCSVGCSPAPKAADEATEADAAVSDGASTGSASAPADGASASASSWRVAPDPVDESAIAQVITADVVVVGAGHAGTACARKLAEDSNKQVIVLEALPQENYITIGNDIGHINSQYLKDHGVPEVDPLEFYEDWMMRSQNAAHPDLIMQYAQRSGEAVDWFLSIVPDEYLETMSISYWPRHENMLDEIARQKFWTGTCQWGMGNEHNMTEVYTAIHQQLTDTLDNLQIDYDREAQYLVKDGDRVTGVVVKDAAGTYYRYDASQAVVLAAGDFGANKEMMTDLCVTANDCFQDGLTEWHDPMGAKDGRGIQMGVWAGGRLEPRPLASMNGDFVIPSMNPGVGIYLNDKGERFCNEFFGDPTWTGKPAARIKQDVYYALFDSNLPDYASRSVSGHTCFDPQEANIQNLRNSFDEVAAAGAEGSRGTFVADDLETLADYMGLDAQATQNMLAAVERYNQMAAAGRDEDYAKDARVLFPVDTPPYMGVVAGPDHVGGVMVTVGGLMTDKHCNVIDEAMDPIPGLYAAGNCLGQRFGVAYFSPIPGVSIGSAMTLGYLLGEHLAQA